jgi:hypothetical protein
MDYQEGDYVDEGHDDESPAIAANGDDAGEVSNSDTHHHVRGGVASVAATFGSGNQCFFYSAPPSTLRKVLSSYAYYVGQLFQAHVHNVGG